MVLLKDVARIKSSEPLTEGDVQSSAWLLWRSVTGEAERKKCSRTADGYYVYRGAFRTHVRNLWPELDKDARVELEKRMYAYLNACGIARCVQKKDPPVWHVAITWNPSTAQATRHPFRMSRTEKRLTPAEAGEDRQPGEVTITVKETEKVTINDHIQQLAEEREVRRELIEEFLGKQEQPLVVDEVAFALGADTSTIRKDIRSLEDEGKVFSRMETQEERRLRYGGDKAFARRSMLVAATEPVPTRTERVAVEGFVAERAERARAMRPDEINRRMFDFVQKTGNRARFTAVQVANKTGLNREVTRVRLLKLESDGVVEHVGFDGGARQYKVANKSRAAASLNVHDRLPEPQQPEPSFSELPPPPAPSEHLNLAARAKEILDENEKLRERCTRLQRELDERSKLVDQLQHDLELARAASVDAETMQRLSAWTPAR